MPSLVRKILIVAAIDGLILTPLHNNHGPKQTGPPVGAVRIDYKSKQIVPHLAITGSGDKDGVGDPGSLEAHGIAGLKQTALPHIRILETHHTPGAQVSSTSLLPLRS